ncbi:MAG: rubrerythrin domain protein [Acidobacteria bacterium]|nr:rubrerythrin domain protein [Acidobacteriota bacterium]
MTIEQAIKTGIEYELQVRKVYSEAAKKFKDPVARKIFTVLADEEDRHVAYLESRLEEWERTGQVTAAALETSVPSEEEINAAMSKLNSRMAEQDFGVELEMLKKALALEGEATAFFREMVAQLQEEEQRLFARFVEIEAGHEAIVQAEIDALTGLGFWFDYTEFRLEGA